MSASRVSLGITGGIGTGKTYFCRLLEEKGIPVFYTDIEAKREMQENDSIKSRLQALVSPEVYDVNGLLNRLLVSRFISRGPAFAHQVDAIVHPAVKARWLRWLSQRTEPVVAMECALLFESGFRSLVDAVVCVTAPLALRLQRVMKRDGRTEEEVHRLMALQANEEEKQRQSDVIILNDGKSDLCLQVEQLLLRIEKKNT